jgi:hypothetical protein
MSNKQLHCVGCDRSLSELFEEYNDMITRFNEKFGTNDKLLEDHEDVLEQSEILYTNCGDWYCHHDCYRDGL